MKIQNFPLYYNFVRISVNAAITAEYSADVASQLLSPNLLQSFKCSRRIKLVGQLRNVTSKK